MAEDVKEVVKEEVAPVVDQTTETTEPAAKEPEYSPIELKAMEDGWTPKDKYEGPEELFVDAAEFIRRGELFSKIEHQRKEMAELRKALRTMQKHHSEVREAEFERALKTLKEQKIAAMKEGEHEQVANYEEQIDEVRDAIAQSKAAAIREQVAQEAPDPRFTAWVEKNSWYARDAELKAFADSIGISYSKTHPNVDPAEVLKYVGDRVRKAYPDRFPRNANRARASSVEGGEGNRSAGNKKSADDYTMTAEEEKVFKTLQRTDPKFWTKERYIGDLKSKSFVKVYE